MFHAVCWSVSVVVCQCPFLVICCHVLAGCCISLRVSIAVVFWSRYWRNEMQTAIVIPAAYYARKGHLSLHGMLRQTSFQLVVHACLWRVSRRIMSRFIYITYCIVYV